MPQCCHHTNIVTGIKQPCIIHQRNLAHAHIHTCTAHICFSQNVLKTSHPGSPSLRPTAAAAYVGTKGNFFLLVDIMKPMVIAVTTRVVVTGYSVTTCSTTPRVLLQASPHLLLRTCERKSETRVRKNSPELAMVCCCLACGAMQCSKTRQLRTCHPSVK